MKLISYLRDNIYFSATEQFHRCTWLFSSLYYEEIRIWKWRNNEKISYELTAIQCKAGVSTNRVKERAKELNSEGAGMDGDVI